MEVGSTVSRVDDGRKVRSSGVLKLGRVRKSVRASARSEMTATHMNVQLSTRARVQAGLMMVDLLLAGWRLGGPGYAMEYIATSLGCMASKFRRTQSRHTPPYGSFRNILGSWFACD